jgi:8-amino-7-oxononanoate synthase
VQAFEAELSERLQNLAQAELSRRLRPVSSDQGREIILEGKSVLNFSSNDYLGLSSHPALKAAATVALERYGTGSGASRLISGSLKPHHDLEDCLAQFKGTEAALAFSSGYATSLGTITALVGSGDIIVLDKLVHASIVDAARLSGAKLRVFAHNDLSDLEDILKWCDRQRKANSKTQILVVTESLFSMDGDFAPLAELVPLKERYGAWLMVDEAHATGLFGETRRGLCEQFEISDRVEVQMGTLGKAIGSAGGYIAGSRALVDYLVNKARSFIFSTAPPPMVLAVAQAGIEVVRSVEGAERLIALRSRIEQFSTESGFSNSERNSPILPVIVGPETAAMELADQLLSQNIFVPAIRYPTVARGKARLRITFSAAHSENDVKRFAEVLRKTKRVP